MYLECLIDEEICLHLRRFRRGQADEDEDEDADADADADEDEDGVYISNASKALLMTIVCGLFGLTRQPPVVSRTGTDAFQINYTNL